MCKISLDKHGLFLFTNGHCFRPNNPNENNKVETNHFNEDDSIKEITFHKENITLHKVIEAENGHFTVSETWYSHGEYLTKKGKYINSKKLFKHKSNGFLYDFLISFSDFIIGLAS